ncbi:ATP-binding cassette domain-containing protein [Pseudoalteromonas sp. L21]|uniref:ATP-binding cassette domain-containing protein n=1 Tax=Pseudoalteromonas sp. L21 TaxID=1539746 RepID=UPI001F0296CD|nr:ATP-binding cassette domain-containing protein [Pseudoalteromonas sp. L21]MCF7517588.1 ATP-binding cassette domain-containing protein [Pseudoalteromonas sp. L21]
MKAVVSIVELQVLYSQGTLLDIPKLDMYKGSQIVIVGGNGAGKTTFLETVLGLRKTHHGEVLIQIDKQDLGVQLQNVTYNPEILVSDVVAMHKCVYRVANSALKTAFNLSELVDKRYGKLSRGQKQRVDLYVAMAHQPSTLVLDEPGTGLDRKYSDLFINLINEYRQREGNTLLMASHTSTELEQASHILWIADGKVVDFTPAALMLNKHLGEFKASFTFPCSKVQSLIIDELQNYKGIQRIDASSQGELLIYGKETIRGSLLALIQRYHLENFSFSKTCYDDFLNLVSQKQHTRKGE